MKKRKVKKVRCPKVFVSVKGMRKVLGVRNGAKLSGCMADSQEFRKIRLPVNEL